MEESNRIRNFCIIAHIDSGKSTLADRFLELTGTIDKRKMQEQFLDMHPLERERGITIKLQPVRMEYKIGKENDFYILNLIDTPGHIDFQYEVSRSLAAVEGAILLVDATKGIQAQTIANFNLAKKQMLKIIPVINKIDLPNAQVEKVKEEIPILFSDSKLKTVFEISAKLGFGVENVLKAIINEIPPPQGDSKKPLQALIFDSKYDPYKGIIAYLRIFNGKIRPGERIIFIAQERETEVLEVGFFKPNLEKGEELKAGEIGYIATGLKDISKVRVGDTITKIQNLFKIQNYKSFALPGYQEPQPMVFASIYPQNAKDYKYLKDSLEKLKLQDSSLKFEQEYSDALGSGFRCGFLGMLHGEIVSERLKRDFNLNLIITPPSVEYKVRLKNKNEEVIINYPSQLPEPSMIQAILEPIVELEILTPPRYLGGIIKLMPEYRAKYLETNYLSSENVVLKFEVPLAEIIVDFYDKLKSLTQGYGSMNYKFVGFQEADLVKLDILIAGKIVSQFSKIVPRAKAYKEGRGFAEKLKNLIPPQLFNLPIQAAIGGKIIARETIKARRKDVTGYLYGGDVTRKIKLLEKQKRGKKKLKERGRVEIPPEVYLEIFKK